MGGKKLTIGARKLAAMLARRIIESASALLKETVLPTEGKVFQVS
jgi:hypothetical protein